LKDDIREDDIRHILEHTKTIAVLGLSDDPTRASHGVAAYLQRAGYRIIPVNPTLNEILGEACYPTLTEAARHAQIDLVDVFRRSDAVPAIVEEAIALGLPALWLQEGVVHEAAAEKARRAGLRVVMDRCMLKEHRRLHP
jgi:predicted CoA-binding protein